MSGQSPHILLATLGGQPQIVTFALDLLLAQGIPINEVVVIHPASYPHIEQSVEHLHTEFADDRYNVGEKTITMHFRRHVLRQHGQPIHDIVDNATADAILGDIDELMRERKQEPCVIHFCITGGRRLMSFFAFAAALLNFDHNDRLWHLYTPDAIREQAKGAAIMHVTPESGVQLIEVPFMRASQSVLAYRNRSNAVDTIRTYNAEQADEERQRCKHVQEQASSRQREVLRLFAQGLDPQQAKQKLHIERATISSHTNKLLAICREVWPNEQFRDYRSIHSKFAPHASYLNDE